jgi:N-acetylglutamate synthase-like GNAT family acetyltransferase
VTITRLLPRDEWNRLAGTEAEAVYPFLPETARVLVAERDGAVVGTWVLTPIYHVECLWVAPALRKSTIAARLWTGMRLICASLGIERVMTGAMTDDVRALLAHVGGEQLPGDHYVLTFSGGR